MNISHNKFQTPIELHRKLGNKYQVELHERMMKKKMMKELLSNEKKRNPLLMYPFSQSNIIHKQIQLESKVDNLASYLQLQQQRDSSSSSRPAPFMLSGDDSVGLSDSCSPSLNNVSRDAQVHSQLSAIDQNVDKIIKYVNDNNNKIVEHLDYQFRSDSRHEANLVNDLESYLRSSSTGRDDGFEPSSTPHEDGDLNEKSFEYGSYCESEPLVRQSTPSNRYLSPKDHSKRFSSPKEVVSSRTQSPPSRGGGRGADLPALISPPTGSAHNTSLSLLSSIGLSGPSSTADPRLQRSSAATKASPGGQLDNQMFVLPAHSREVATEGASSQLSFQDQVYRFAEIKALFEVASPPSRVTPGQEQSVLSVGSGSHSAFEDPKLTSEIKRHKERIINGRNSNAGGANKSPRSQIHKPKAIARHHPGGGVSDSMDPTFDCTSNTSAKVQQIQEQIQLLQLQLQLQHIVRQSSLSSDSQQQQQQQPSPQKKKNSFGADKTKLAQLSLLATTGSKASLATESSPLRMAYHRGASSSSSSSAQKPPAAARMGTVALLSAEAFSEAADKINRDIESAITSVVTDALVADGKSRHYTNRFQQLTMSRARQPLEKKVQALLGEKLVKLKAELDDLRAAKLTNAEGYAPFKFELEGIVDTEDDSRKLSVVQSVDLSSELKQSVEAILKRRNIDTDELFLSEFQAAAVSALKQAFKSANQLRQRRADGDLSVRDLSVMELLSMDTLRGISRADLGNLRKMSKHILLDGKLSHKQHLPAATKDDVAELGKVLNIGEGAVISEHSLRGMSRAELLKLTKMTKEILVEGKNEKAVVGEASLLEAAEVSSSPRRTGTPKARGGQVYNLLSDDSGDSRNSTPDRTPRRPQRVHPPGSSSRSRLITIVDKELSPLPTNNDDKASTGGTAAAPTPVSDLNQSIDLELWSLENSLLAERSRRDSVDAQKSKLKLELKIWQDHFEKEQGRPPGDAEKAGMKDKFVAYQSLSADAKLAARAVRDLENKLRALRAGTGSLPTTANSVASRW